MTPPTMYEGPPPHGKPGPTGLPGMQRRRSEPLRASPRFVVGGLLAIAGLGGYLYLRAHPDLPLAEQVEQLIAAAQAPLDALKQRVQLPSAARSILAHHEDPTVAPSTSAPPAAASSSTARKPPAPSKGKPSATHATPEPEPLTPQTTIVLANGERLAGELVRETPDGIVLRWGYGEAAFKRTEIRQMIKPAASHAPTDAAAHDVTLQLNNGGLITGTLVHELPEAVILRVDGGEVSFRRDEIRRVDRADQAASGKKIVMPWEGQGAAWPYQHDVVVKLMKGTAVDGAITSVTPQSVVVVQTVAGGGQIEHTIARADVDQLLFKPVHTDRTKAIEENLRKLFPHMSWTEEGLFTVVSDSTGPAVKEYRKTIRELATDWYFTFYPLVKDRAPTGQRYIVVFDDWQAYIEYAITDGIPGWLAVGYFHPEQDVLYCFNMLGDRFSELLYQAYLGQFRGARDRVSDAVKGSREEVFIEGQMSEFLQKLERTHAIVRDMFSQLSVEVLRHELTHSMFSAWKLQGIILSKLPATDAAQVEKKRAFLQSKDDEQKRQLLDELLAGQKKEPLPAMQASNSWFVEGLAGYMEPSPVGGINTERLFEVQEARRANQLLPFAGLNTFRVGSFPGLSTRGMLYAYAQSWAFCHFLMHQHRDGFLHFLDRMAHEHPADQGEELAWLIQAVGKEQGAVEAEFSSYLEQFPPEDSPVVKQMKMFLDLRDELTSLYHRLWG